MSFVLNTVICITCTMVHRTVINVEHFVIASAGFSFCLLVSPFRERNNFIRLKKKKKIVLYLQISILYKISASALLLKYS